jgi:integrase
MADNKKQNRKRRGRGEGSVYEGADGRWVGRLSLGRDGNGKRKRLVVYGETKREVLDEIAKLQSKKAAGTLDDAAKMTVEAYLTTWLQDAAKPKLRSSTLESYEAIIRLHINAQVGKVLLSKLTPLHVRCILTKMADDNYSPRRIQYVRTVLKRALSQAVKWGMLTRNVCDVVESPRVPKHEITPLNDEQSVKFLRAVEKDPLRLLYVLAVATGLRQGELLGLQWTDIDLKAGTLSVRRTMQFKRGEFWTEEPKTKKGRRLIELGGIAAEAIHAHRAEALRAGRMGHQWVFCRDDGTPLNRFHIIAAYERLLRAAELPAIRFHDLRHTSATLLLQAGVHPKVVQERLGHSTIAVTMDTYSHVMPGMQRDAANRLDGVLKANGHQLATKTASDASAG